LLGDVDLLAAEHGVDAVAQAGGLGELDQQPHGLVGDAVLRVVEVQPHRLERQALAALGIVGEQLAQVHLAHGLVVGGEGAPRRRRGGAHALTAWPWSEALLEAITPKSSSHDFTNVSAPCVWSLVARASTSTPAAANWPRTSSQSPPSTGRRSGPSVWLPSAFSVA